MRIPLPFPYCQKCGKKSLNSYHHTGSCGGLLEIDPDTIEVTCTKCKHSWNIWNSRYFCSCGNVFEAKEVKEAVDELIEDCKLCAEEIELLEQARRIRRKVSQDSKETFVAGLLDELGHSVGKIAGYAFTKLVEFIVELLGH